MTTPMNGPSGPSPATPTCAPSLDSLCAPPPLPLALPKKIQPTLHIFFSNDQEFRAIRLLRWFVARIQKECIASSHLPPRTMCA